jgi:uncharacterized protein YndB with AHSA1/START domain
VSALSDFTAGTIHASIEIEAAPEVVWDALTEPAQLMSWWGSPDTYRTFDWQVDLRPGGKWSSRAERLDGSNQGVVHGEYLEVERPHVLVYTWIPSWDGDAETTIRMELAATAAGTRVKVRHSGFADRTASGAGHAQGWVRVLGWLAEHAALRSRG